MVKLFSSTLKVFILILLSSTPKLVAAEPFVIRYLHSDTGLFDYRTHYYLEMVQLGAAKMGLEIELKPQSLKEMRDNRAMEELEKGSFDIFWMATNPEREERLVPIRVPLFKGLNGWRICIVNNQRQALFTNLKDLNEIKNLIALQGIDWPDTEVFIASGYKVKRSVSWSGMFEQISLNRHDYFPRAVTEIFTELESRQHLNLAVEPNIVFTYPTAFYLFTNKENTQLAALLEQGLKKAIADGSFEDLFIQFHGEAIQKANLAHRTRIQLQNPALPPNTPLDDASLWFNPHSK